MTEEERLLNNLAEHIEKLRKFRTFLNNAGYAEDLGMVDTTISYLEMYKETLTELIKALNNK